MATIWKPTSAEQKIIREAAQDDTGKKRLRLEVGWRYRTDDHPVPANVVSNNILLVTEDPDWDWSDLSHLDEWEPAMQAGFALTDDGRATVDVYVYGGIGGWVELLTNVVVHYANGQIEWIEGVGGHTLYRA